jgi:GDPmannose 4,6-dehydratase
MVSEITEFELLEVYNKFQYTHIFNFAADSFVQESSLNFSHFIKNNSFLLFELLKLRSEIPGVWIFHPLSSEIISNGHQIKPQHAPFILDPRNAYGVGKALDYFACKVAHEYANMSINFCVMFNHESRYRSRQFFSKKVINFFQNLKNNTCSELEIYNCTSQRDWGSAVEYMQLVFQAGLQNVVGETMLGTGHLLSVERFVDLCISELDLDCTKMLQNGLIVWRGKNFTIKEKSRDCSDAKRVMRADHEIVLKTFKQVPQIFGKSLVRELLNDKI